MRRFGVRLASVALVLLLAGCGGGGLEEGMPKDAPQGDGRPAGFADMMKKMEKDMPKPGKGITPPPASKTDSEK